MAIRNAESFMSSNEDEQYKTVGEWRGATIISTDAPTGGSRSAESQLANSSTIGFSLGGDLNPAWLSFWTKRVGVGSLAFVEFRDGPLSQMSVQWNNTGLEIRRGGSFLSAPGITSTPDVWEFIQLFYRPAASGGELEFWRNGVLAHAITPTNTIGQSLYARANRALFFATAGTVRFAEIVSSDTAGAAPTGRPGRTRVSIAPVVRAGSAAGFTPSGAATNHEALDDQPNDGNTTVTRASAAGTTDLLGAAAPSLVTGLILGARPVISGRHGVSSLPVAAVLRVGGTEVVADAGRRLPTSFGKIAVGAFEPQNPATLGAWSNTAINASEAGARIASARSARRWHRFTMHGAVVNTNAPNIGEIELRATVGGANQVSTSNASAFASSVFSTFVANNVLDGSALPVWSALAASEQWVIIRADAPIVVEQVAITGSNDGNFSPFAITYESSADGGQWDIEWFMTPGTWTASQTKVFTRPSISGAARYWMIRPTERNNDLITAMDRIGLAEVAFRNGGGNLLTGGTAIASGDSFGNVAARAVDGNASLAWYHERANNGLWWAYDFGGGSLAAPATVELTSDGTAGNLPIWPTRFFVCRSGDGAAWAPVAAIRAAAWTISTTQVFTLDTSSDVVLTAAGIEVVSDELVPPFVDAARRRRVASIILDDRAA